MEDFATYILKEKDYVQKMLIAYYLSKKTGIYLDKSVILKTEIARIFVNYMKIDVDENILLTAMLLCNCRKIDDAQKIGRLETFAKDGAEYLSTLGFNKRFCKICEEVNRYSGSTPREKESDILEVVDQFTGLILNRIEREAFTTEEALVILQERNLKYVDNRYLNDFVQFVRNMEKVYIREMIDVPVIKKLVSLHNREANVKTFIAAIGNKYCEKIDKAIERQTRAKARRIMESKENANGKEKVVAGKRIPETKKQVANSQRALFSKEIAERVLNHKSTYKVEE